METTEIDFISNGTVTSPAGFIAGATHAGIKKDGDRLDLGILYSEAPCVTAGMFTSSRIKSAPVILCQEKLKGGRAVAVVVNSGCANAYTGEQGMADAIKMAELAAEGIGVPVTDVLVASTGVTGYMLPMELITEGIGRIVLSNDGGHELARAIMTTDTVPKEVAVKTGSGEFTIGGIAKGSGMIHPNLATMFCFLTTDASAELDFIKSALKKSVDKSFHMMSIDGDTSPSDTVLLMANGLAGNETIKSGNREAEIFQQALDEICIYLTKALARDGEGATKLIEVTVKGAKNITEARIAAKAVVSSNLIKTAVHGGDPNWGRVIMALGNSGLDVELSKIDLSIGEIAVLERGKALPFSEEGVVRVLAQEEVMIAADLNMGTASATAWGCDMSEEYVTINSQYMT